MNYLKPLLLLAIQLLIMISISSCTNFDEKNYSGTGHGEFPLHYEFNMKYSDQNQVTYLLKIIPSNGEEFLKHLKEKWHDEAQLKFSAYEKIKEYCDTFKNEALCFNYNDMKKEVESKEVSIFYTVNLYDNQKNELDNISGKFTYDLNNKENLQDRWLQAAGNITMTREKLRNIASVALHFK